MLRRPPRALAPTPHPHPHRQVRFEPLEGDETGFQFEQAIKGGSVPKEYIPGVSKGLESIMGAGILAGFPVIGKRRTHGPDPAKYHRRTPTFTGPHLRPPPFPLPHSSPSPSLTHHSPSPSGVKATLTDGAYHDVDSSVMAFEIAGRQAARQGLRAAGAKLMEPMMKVGRTRTLTLALRP